MVKKCYLLLTIASFLFVSSCVTPDDLTAEKIINKSIQFHDPNGEWANFVGRYYLNSQSVFTNNELEKLVVTIDVPKNAFVYNNTFRKVIVSMSADSCHVVSGEATCASYSWTKNFYTYVWGLPMKLNDFETPLAEEVKTVTFDGMLCYELNVNYENDTWFYFINKKTYQLEGFKFYTNQERTKGETVYLSKIKTVGGMQIPSFRKWTDVVTDSILGTTEMTRFEKLE